MWRVLQKYDDFKSESSCVRFVQDKATEHGLAPGPTRVVTVVGPTSAGKTSLINNLIGAYVGKTELTAATPRPHVYAVVEPYLFKELCPGAESTQEPVDLFPRPAPPLTKGSDSRYDKLYCQTDRKAAILRTFSIPASLQPDVTVVNAGVLQESGVVKPRDGVFEGYHEVYVDTKGSDNVDPTVPGSASSLPPFRSLLRRSARTIYCLPEVHSNSAGAQLQAFEDQMLRAWGRRSPYNQTNYEALQAKAQGQCDPIDPHLDLWRSTLFVMMKMDRLRGLDSFQDAAYTVGTLLKEMRNVPMPDKVLLTAAPSEMVPHAAFRTVLEDRFYRLQENLHRARATSMCLGAEELYHTLLQKEKERMVCVKRFMPQFVGNRDSFYLKKLGERQQCPGNWWRATTPVDQGDDE